MSIYEYKPCKQCIYYGGYFISSEGIKNECMHDRLHGLGKDKNDFGSYFTVEYVDCKDRNEGDDCYRYEELTVSDKIGINMRCLLDNTLEKFSLSHWIFGKW